jgi:hypothetical protein
MTLVTSLVTSLVTFFVTCFFPYKSTLYCYKVTRLQDIERNKREREKNKKVLKTLHCASRQAIFSVVTLSCNPGHA